MNKFFDINSVAIVGASIEEGKIGNSLLRNLSNFEGNKYGVNPKGGSFENIDFFDSIENLPEVVDCLVFAIPAKFVKNSLIEAGEKGIKRVIIISAGFKEVGNIEEENELVEIAKKYDISLLGPNCLGYADIQNNLNLSFGTSGIKPGNIAMISQSGAMAVALTDWASCSNIGFSKIISMGNKAGIDEVDLLRELDEDDETKVIAIYIESLERGEQFYALAKKVTKNKPVVLIKSGVSDLGELAASSHTGALSSTKEILQTAFAHSGVHSTNSLEDFFLLSEIFSKVDLGNIPEELAIITNAGGPGVMATDHTQFENVVLTKFSDSEKEILKIGLPESASVNNPIDIIGDATSKTYSQILNNFTNIVEVNCEAREGALGYKKRAILIMLTAQSVTDVENIAESVIEYKKQNPEQFILVSFMGGKAVAEGRNILKNAGILEYDYPKKAIKIFSNLVEQKKYIEKKEEKIENFNIPENILELRNKLKAEEKFATNKLTGDVLESFGINCINEYLVNSHEDIEKLYEKYNFDLSVAKISSPDIPHKTDVGGVILEIGSLDEAKKAYDEILESVKKHKPEAKINGIVFAKYIPKDNSIRKIFTGFKRDDSFGDILIVGMGGVYVNVFEDVSRRIGIVSKNEIKKMLEELRGYPILSGFRGQCRIDFDKLIDIIFKLQFVFKECKEITEIDINPIFSSEKESIVVDAKFYLD